MLLLLANADLVESKDVALESLIKNEIFIFKNDLMSMWQSFKTLNGLLKKDFF